MSGGSGWVPLGQRLGVVDPRALLGVRQSLLVVEVVFRVLGKLVVLVWLLLELPDLQSRQVKEEDKTGSHRHKQVPLLGLHVCCGAEGVEDEEGGTRGRGQRRGLRTGAQERCKGHRRRAGKGTRRRETGRSAPPTTQELYPHLCILGSGVTKREKQDVLRSRNLKLLVDVNVTVFSYMNTTHFKLIQF